MKGLPRSMSRGKPQLQAVRRQRVNLSNFLVSMTGTAGIGFGTAVIGDVPEGNILLLGMVGYFTLDDLASASILDTFNATVALGTAPTADSTLAGAEVDLLAAAALGAATAGVSPTGRFVNPVQAILDNTDGAMELNINVTIPDTDISGDVPVRVNGYVDFVYAVLGDD